MKTFIVCLFGFGILETLSNAFHLSKGNVSAIARSARKQHQEIPLASPDAHFFYKVILMLILGVLFMASSALFFIKYPAATVFTFVNTLLLSLYGLIQLIMYYRTWRVWLSFLVYSIPLLFFFILFF